MRSYGNLCELCKVPGCKINTFDYIVKQIILGGSRMTKKHSVEIDSCGLIGKKDDIIISRFFWWTDAVTIYFSNNNKESRIVTIDWHHKLLKSVKALEYWTKKKSNVVRLQKHGIVFNEQLFGKTKKDYENKNVSNKRSY
jgi:hypothetical protein